MNVIEIRPSRRLVLLLAGGHALAAFSCLFLPEPWQVCLGLAIVALSLVRELGAARRGAFVLGMGEDGGLYFAPEAAVDGAPARVTSSTVVSGGAIWLVWREARGGGAGARLLVRDQMAPTTWRALQVWLRLRVGSLTAAASGNT